MKLNRKGFTLIELLAVIVVLGIILAIAIPKVVDTIENSKKGSFDTSVKAFIKEAQQYVTKSEINGSPVTSGSIADLNMKNKNGWVGYWETDANGKVYFIVIANNDFVAYNASSNNVSSQKLSEPFSPYIDITDVDAPQKLSDAGFVVYETTLTGYSENSKNVIIPNGITDIDYNIFFNKGLENVIIPNSIESIGARAFAENYFTSVIIPNTNTNTLFFELAVFEKNPLKTIINKSGNKNWKNILGATSCTPNDGGTETNFSTGTCNYSYEKEGNTITGTVTITN